jgi:hypothetical protein
MKEIIEFRIFEKDAKTVLKDNQGVLLGESVRKLKLTMDDPLARQIGQLDIDARARGSVFFTYWDITRTYTDQEIAVAETFQLGLQSRYEPAGEECGTIYDESTACLICGAGRRQVSDLVLNVGRLPKTRDIAMTIADEMVVNARLANLIRERGITGADLRPVRHAGRNRSFTRSWYQLCIAPPFVRVDARTRAAQSPWDDDDLCRCPLGHVIGRQPTTELWINRLSWSGNDIARTQEYVGLKRGLLRPDPMLLITPRFFRLLRNEGIKGWKFEVAHLVGE